MLRFDFFTCMGTRLCMVYRVALFSAVAVAALPLCGQSIDDSGRPSSLIRPNSVNQISSFRSEWRISASFRKHPSGLEVAVLHDRAAKTALFNPDGTRQAALEVGDVIQEVNGVRVASVEDLFGQLSVNGGRLPLSVVDVQTGRAVLWQAAAPIVNVPLGLQKANADGTGRVHLIHAVATNDPGIGKNLELNVGPMQGLWTEHIGAQYRGQYVKLVGDDCSAINIIVQLSRLSVNSQDTLLFYYQGHGAFDSNFSQGDPAGGHFLDFPNEDLLRSELLLALQAKGARLTILASDACNVESSMDIVPRQAYAAQMVEVQGWTGMEELMLCYRGTLDLTSSSRGQRSWSTKDIGGWFTSAWLAGLSVSSMDPQGQRSWEETWDQIRLHSEKTYMARWNQYALRSATLRAQKSMVPQEFVWDIQRDDPPNAPQTTRRLLLTAGKIAP